MADSSALDILKSALLLETRGKAFYLKAAEQAQSQAVKEFFEMMADEEVSHIEILSEQFKAYQSDRRFAPGNFNQTIDSVATTVLDAKLGDKITAAGFESAAISAAMAMEERAVKLYSQRAAAAEDPEEKALYSWLADWEKQHLALLSRIDRKVTENIWNDNQFWPF